MKLPTIKLNLVTAVKVILKLFKHKTKILLTCSQCGSENIYYDYTDSLDNEIWHCKDCNNFETFNLNK